MPCTEHDVGFSAEPAECSADGTTREVEFTIVNGTGNPDATYSLDFESDGSDDVVDRPLPAGSTATESHWYSVGATYNATLTVTFDDGSTCSEVRSFHVEPCCSVEVTVTEVVCSGGYQHVSVTLVNTGVIAVDYELDFVSDGSVDESGTLDTSGSSMTATHSHAYDASSPTSYEMTISFADATGTPCDPYTHSIDVEPCEDGDDDDDDPHDEVECPWVRWDTPEYEECERGRREVTVSATVYHTDPSEVVGATLAVGAKKVDTDSATTPFTLTYTTPVGLDPSAGPHVAKVTFPSHPDCPPSELDIELPACGATEEDDEETTDDSTERESGDCRDAERGSCCLLCWLFAVVIAADLVLTAMASPVAILTWLLTIGIGAALRERCGRCVFYCCALKGLLISATGLIISGIVTEGVTLPIVAVGLLAIAVLAMVLRVIYARDCECWSS